MLDEPVLTQLEVEVLQLVQCERVVISPMEIAYLRLFLSDLRCRTRPWIRIRRLQAELPGVHVVLLTSLNGRCGKCTSPPKKGAQHDVARMVDVENVLPRHEVLCPK